ncbi:hypothetical protein [Cereibacter changlensis]|uniref:hypothetical protein n=1 Tax=Cereibacter changlensis TaxID=402884 RepID=UPI00403381D6
MLNVAHPAKLPSIEDKSILKSDEGDALDKGRAVQAPWGHISRMQEEQWRIRLLEEVQKSKRSMRSISLAAKCGPNYLHGILKEGKDPTVGYLSAICREMGLSVAYVLYGVNITPEKEGILAMLDRADPESREIALAILKRARQG